MIDLFYIQIFLFIILISQLITFISPLIIVKLNGKDPHGLHTNYSTLARLTPISYFLLLLFVISYIFFINLIDIFWTFHFIYMDLLIFIGIVIVTSGLILEMLGILELGLNFRIELPKEKTALITSGVYRLMRNPIAFSLYLLVFGIFLISSNIFTLVILTLNVITFNAKVKCEESYLQEHFGKNYEKYKKKVGRYLPFKIRKNN
jgi:protein-S-isoprenylcysteine O-methyltransferase Ste14